jgi:hypothetical protein
VASSGAVQASPAVRKPISAPSGVSKRTLPRSVRTLRMSTVNFVPTTSTVKRGVRTSKCWPGVVVEIDRQRALAQLDDAPVRAATRSPSRATASPRRRPA